MDRKSSHSARIVSGKFFSCINQLHWSSMRNFQPSAAFLSCREWSCHGCEPKSQASHRVSVQSWWKTDCSGILCNRARSQGQGIQRSSLWNCPQSTRSCHCCLESADAHSLFEVVPYCCTCFGPGSFHLGIVAFCQTSVESARSIHHYHHCTFPNRLTKR